MCDKYNKKYYKHKYDDDDADCDSGKWETVKYDKYYNNRKNEKYVKIYNYYNYEDDCEPKCGRNSCDPCPPTCNTCVPYNPCNPCNPCSHKQPKKDCCKNEWIYASSTNPISTNSTVVQFTTINASEIQAGTVQTSFTCKPCATYAFDFGVYIGGSDNTFTFQLLLNNLPIPGGSFQAITSTHLHGFGVFTVPSTGGYIQLQNVDTLLNNVITINLRLHRINP